MGGDTAICKLSISDTQHAVLNNGMYAENAFRRLNKKCDSSWLFARFHNVHFITSGKNAGSRNGNRDLKERTELIRRSTYKENKRKYETFFKMKI